MKFILLHYLINLGSCVQEAIAYVEDWINGEIILACSYTYKFVSIIEKTDENPQLYDTQTKTSIF